MTDADWQDLDGKALRRTFSFADWQAALLFVNELSPVAEALQHHPDVELSWGRVTVLLSTHDAGGRITEKDRVLAAAINALWDGRAPAR